VHARQLPVNCDSYQGFRYIPAKPSNTQTFYVHPLIAKQ